MNTIATFRKCTLTDEELLKKVDRLTDEMFAALRVPSRQIPARPDDDYDLLVGEMILRFKERVEKPKNEEPGRRTILKIIKEHSVQYSGIGGNPPKPDVFFMIKDEHFEALATALEEFMEAEKEKAYEQGAEWAYERGRAK